MALGLTLASLDHINTSTSTQTCLPHLQRNHCRAFAEGSWVETPTTWSNDYYQYLRDFEFVKSTAPSGKTQWQIKGDPAIKSAPKAHGSGTEVRLTVPRSK